jgi:hypothetical protein
MSHCRTYLVTSPSMDGVVMTIKIEAGAVIDRVDEKTFSVRHGGSIVSMTNNVGSTFMIHEVFDDGIT